MNSIAITDHGNMYGVLKFFNAAKKKGVKPIHWLRGLHCT